jgi:hypothetical protein
MSGALGLSARSSRSHRARSSRRKPARCTSDLHVLPCSRGPLWRAGLLSPEEKAEWERHNPSPLIRTFRQLASYSGWLARGVAAVAETPLGGRVLFDAVVKPATGARARSAVAVSASLVA